MIALLIISAIVILIILILRMNVHIIFDYHDKPTVTLKVLFFRFNAIDLFHKYLNRGSADSGQAKIEKKKTTSANKKKSLDLIGFADFLVHISKVISLAVKDHFSKATVNLKELNVKVCSDDAAKTALLCGTVIQVANGLCALLMHFSTFRCNNRNLSISPDFSSEKSSVSLHLVLTSKLFDIIRLFITTYFRFFEGKENNYARNSIKTSH